MQNKPEPDRGDAVHMFSRDRLWAYRILGLLSGTFLRINRSSFPEVLR
jgi:hypothetical protein